MSLNEKLTVLSKIANIFNNNNVTWAVGASLLLYFKGILNNFRDIDIVMSEDDVDTVKELLSRSGILLPSPPNTQYETRVFLEYVIDGVDIDIMAGLVIVNSEGEHYFPLKRENIAEYIEVGNTSVPLQSLEEWKLYYSLMGRTERVRLIEQALGKRTL